MVFHHSHNHEGGAGLRLYHCSSTNNGLSWSVPTPVEKSLSQPSHDGYQLVHPRMKRIYLVYGYNDNQLHYVDRPSGSHVDLPRGDMQLEAGFRIKVSDDGGLSFGRDRYDVPGERGSDERSDVLSRSCVVVFMPCHALTPPSPPSQCEGRGLTGRTLGRAAPWEHSTATSPA